MICAIMETSNKSLLKSNTSEKSLRTYQRCGKAALQKEAQLAEKKDVKINILEIQTQDKNPDNILVQAVPPEMLMINIEEVMSSTHFDPELLNVVKDRSLSTTFKPKPKPSEEVLVKLEGSEDIEANPTVSRAVVAQPQVTDILPKKSKESEELLLSKSIGSGTGVAIPSTSQIVLQKPKAVQKGLAKSSVSEVIPAKPVLLTKSNVSERNRVKSRAPKTVLIKTEVPKEMLKKPEMLKEKIGNPTIPERIPTTSKMSKRVLAKPKVSRGVINKSDELREVLTKPKMLVKSTVHIDNSLSVEKSKVPVPKTVLVKRNVLEPAAAKSKVPKLAIVKPKTPVLTPGKPGTREERLVNLNKRGGSLLVPSQSESDNPTVKSEVEETDGVTQVEARGLFALNLPEYIVDYDSKINVDPPATLTLQPLTPIPLPPIVDEPSNPGDAVQLLKEHITPLLPRRWSLRVEDDAIYAFLFSPGVACVAQRAICAPIDGSELKFIVHAKVIPKHHSVYQYRLMKPPAPLTPQTVHQYANSIMGAVHSIIQHHVCAGLDEEHFIREWQEHTEDCRLDENLFQEEGYERTLRSIKCSFLLRRKNYKRCPECSHYQMIAKTRERRHYSPSGMKTNEVKKFKSV